MVKSKKITITNHFRAPSVNFKIGLIFNPLFFSKLVSRKQKRVFYAYSRNKFVFNKFKATCMMTGRQRGIMSKFFMSRIIFKKFAMSCQMSGFKKSRW